MENVAAVVFDGIVENVVVWSDELPSQLPNKTLVRLTGEDVAGIGWTYHGGKDFRVPSPYESWIWNDKQREWQPPTQRPEPDDDENPTPYDWDEETVSWVVPQWWLDEQAELERQEEEEA